MPVREFDAIRYSAICCLMRGLSFAKQLPSPAISDPTYADSALQLEANMLCFLCHIASDASRENVEAGADYDSFARE